MGGDARRTALWGIGLAMVCLVALNAAATFLLRGVRVDLTSDGMYSLSPGVRTLLARLEEPVRLELYWSQDAGEAAPTLRAHAQRVREFLEAITAEGEGLLSLEFIDPVPFSEAEDAARAAGLSQLQVDGVGTALTLGLVARGPTDKVQALPYLSPDQDPFLEYEVASAIATVGRGRKPTIGLLSTLPFTPQFNPTNPSGGGVPVSIQRMEQLFDVQRIDPEGSAIPAGLDALMIVQPRNLPDAMLRAIDGWVLTGKPTMVLFDPWCETDPKARSEGLGGNKPGTIANLGPLPAAWGFAMPMDMVVGDRKAATRIQARTMGGKTVQLDYLPWLSLTREAMSPTDPITGSLSGVNLMSAGEIQPAQGATTRIEPLIQSSGDSQLIQSLKLGFFGETDRLVKDFKPDGRRKMLAARLRGPIRSPFGAGDGTANVLVIGDADLMDDTTWIQADANGGRRAISDNGPLLFNALETLVGDRALADLRSRGQSRRPFTRVEAMRKEAETRYVAREQELQKQVKDAEFKVAQLQRDGAGPDGGLLSPEQQKALETLSRDVMQARSDLRSVQLELRREVEDTGRSLMVLNVVAWPLIVAALATAWAMARAAGSRRRVEPGARSA
jgi:ABC-type uncharacterized transport system involved in gliding motility auxiliary subunit